MHCLARETIASAKECQIIACMHACICSHELGNEFVLEVTLFRTNKSCLYFVNNDSSFHSKHFIKFHQLFDNNILFKVNNVWLIFDNAVLRAKFLVSAYCLVVFILNTYF